MSSENKTHSEWTLQEINILKYYEPKFKSKKWKNISNQLQKRGFYRSETQCRERWVNYLDPKANKSKWEEEELQILYGCYQEVGTRWCQIQKKLNRTQNSIKNRFYGTLRNVIRFILGYFDSRRTCHNISISKLSPKLLTQLYGSLNDFCFLEGQVKSLIYEMKFIVDKKVIVEHIKKDRKKYQKINQVILNHFQKMEQIINSSLAENTSLGEELNQEEPKIKQEVNQINGYTDGQEEDKPEISATVIQEAWNQNLIIWQQNELIRTLLNLNMNQYFHQSHLSYF